MSRRIRVVDRLETITRYKLQRQNDPHISLDRHGRKVAVGAEGIVSTVGVALIKQIDDTGKQIDVLGQPVATTPIEHDVAFVLGGIGGIDVVLMPTWLNSNSEYQRSPG